MHWQQKIWDEFRSEADVDVNELSIYELCELFPKDWMKALPKEQRADLKARMDKSTPLTFKELVGDVTQLIWWINSRVAPIQGGLVFFLLIAIIFRWINGREQSVGVLVDNLSHPVAWLFLFPLLQIIASVGQLWIRNISVEEEKSLGQEGIYVRVASWTERRTGSEAVTEALGMIVYELLSIAICLLFFSFAD